jgi:hypothetical protein
MESGLMGAFLIANFGDSQIFAKYPKGDKDRIEPLRRLLFAESWRKNQPWPLRVTSGRSKSRVSARAREMTHNNINGDKQQRVRRLIE